MEKKPALFQISLKFMVIMTLFSSLMLGLVVAFYLSRVAEQERQRERIDVGSAELLVMHFVQGHPGQWPRSWEELWNDNKTYPQSIAVAYDLSLERNVLIDFKLTLDDAAKQGLSNFTAIRHSNPKWQTSDLEYTEVFIDAIREVQIENLEK